MAMKTRPCIRCRSATQPAVLESAASESDSLALRIERMPVLACPEGHRQFVSADFPRWLVEHLMGEDEAKLPSGREEGLVFKHYRCGECGADLAKVPDGRKTFAFDVELLDVDPFRVELTVPVYKCPSCSKEQLHSLKEVRGLTPQVLGEAFRAAEIPPG